MKLRLVEAAALKRPPVLDKCHRFTRPARMASAGLYPYFHALMSAQEPEVICQGRQMILLCSNNYLGLSTHPDVVRAANVAIDQAVYHVAHLARQAIAQYAPGHPPPEFALEALQRGVVAVAAAEESYWALVRREVGR